MCIRMRMFCWLLPTSSSSLSLSLNMIVYIQPLSFNSYAWNDTHFIDFYIVFLHHDSNYKKYKIYFIMISIRNDRSFGCDGKKSVYNFIMLIFYSKPYLLYFISDIILLLCFNGKHIKSIQTVYTYHKI